MDKNDITLENMDVESLKQSLEDSGINLEGVNLDDIDLQEKLKEIIEFLKDPRKFQRLGGRIPKGVLLVGPFVTLGWFRGAFRSQTH